MAEGRFVRGATLSGESGAQRVNVLMQDDRLGRIALRMVDRGGLIHAVVRTDGGRAAQVLSESLPVLIESLNQRGLTTSLSSSQGWGHEQSDSHQGQPRRQRQGGQAAARNGRQAVRAPAPGFQVEVT